MTSSWPDLMELPGVAVAVEAARDALAGLALHPANRRGWPKSAAAAAIRGARASATMDGGDPSLDISGTSVTDPVLAGAIRCYSAVGTLAATFGRAPLQAIARLHTLAAADLAEEATLGRPAVAPATAARLAGIADLVRDSGWPAPIVVALVHAELSVLQPFSTANGVVARCAGRLAMVHSGLDPHALSVPEVAYLRSGPRYEVLLADYAANTPDALPEWLVFTCSALEAGAREGRSIADAVG